MDEFKNLDLRKITCFGWQAPKDKNWQKIAAAAATKGWSRSVDKKAFESCFAANVEASYKNLMVAVFEDLDTSILWQVAFDNNKKLFDLSIFESAEAEVTLEQKAAFFKSDMFKRTSKRAYACIIAGRDTYNKTVAEHVNAGELLEVDEPKLEAILAFCSDQQLLSNFRLGKYIK